MKVQMNMHNLIMLAIVKTVRDSFLTVIMKIIISEKP